MLVLAGIVSLALAVVPLPTADGTTLAVMPSTAVVLPSEGTFGTKSLVLYGRVGGDPPGDGALGCDVTSDTGHDVGLKVSALAAFGAGRRAVDGLELEPLATVTGFVKGWLFTCTGPAATTSQPLYLLGERRRPIPRAVAASFGVTSLALGAGGLAVGRRRPRPVGEGPGR